VAEEAERFAQGAATAAMAGVAPVVVIAPGDGDRAEQRLDGQGADVALLARSDLVAGGFDLADEFGQQTGPVFEEGLAQAFLQPPDVAFPVVSPAGVYLLEGGFEEGFGFRELFFGG